ncbi:DUF397 domain-containing protein [Streptosporangium sp. NPDC002544]|uniref:DUF397 domain-containing protein n=1 Tax=Streptosporangium sp. NPDC002544 TaxID=3154538 RepID=UPI00332389D7
MWRKSTRSGAQSNYVEARFDGTTIWLHNSNNPSPQGPAIAITPKTWPTLLDQVQAGNLTPRKPNSPTPSRTACSSASTANTSPCRTTTPSTERPTAASPPFPAARHPGQRLTRDQVGRLRRAATPGSSAP